VGKSKTKRPVGRPRCMWENNNKLDLRQKGWDGIDWISLVQQRDQLEGSSEHDNESSGSIKFWEILE
jgi:hypothetical protein